jgi:uncharacterized membrane protein YhaH (DUF805 family)
MIVHAWEKTIGMFTPRLVRRVLLPVSCAVFFGSLVVASLFYFAEKPFDLKAIVISDLESPEDNPRGYGVGAAGTAVCGILLIPAAAVSYRRLQVVRRKLALAGTVLLGAGLAAAIAIGFLAPFTTDYTTLHIQLAFAAFIGICAGTLVCSIIAALPALETGGSCGPRLVAMVVLQGSVILFLVYLYFTPHFFNYKGLFTSLAFWEWLLCANCVASLWMMIAALDGISPQINSA